MVMIGAFCRRIRSSCRPTTCSARYGHGTGRLPPASESAPMDTSRGSADESQALRRCLRGLTALSTLSAVWSGCDLRQIAAGLSGVPCRSLPVAFVYVRLNDEDGKAVEASAPEGALPHERVEILRRPLEPLLTTPGAHRQPPSRVRSVDVLCRSSSCRLG